MISIKNRKSMTVNFYISYIKILYYFNFSIENMFPESLCPTKSISQYFDIQNTDYVIFTCYSYPTQSLYLV